MKKAQINKQQEIKSYADSVRKITKHRFGVDSKSDPTKSHLVQRVPKSDIWYCDCKYFHYSLTRKPADERLCYHIEACIVHREKEFTARNMERLKVEYYCPKCNSTIFNKYGTRKIMGDTKRQLYKCVQCKYRFSLLPKGFVGHRSSPEVIGVAIHLFMRSMTSRNVSRQIKLTHNVSITHSTIIRWVKKYIRIIKRYLDKLIPELSDVWSIDEMVLNVKDTEKMAKGFHVWLWSIIDPETRFLIASTISKKREIKDARTVIKKGKNVIGNTFPDYVISDSLRTYEKAIRKEFQSRVAHIKTKAIRDGFTNRPIERYHNEIRENLKTRRGLGNDESALDFAEMLRINHNFIKPHMGLGGKTPAESAGIDLELGDDKIGGLIRKSNESDRP